MVKQCKRVFYIYIIYILDVQTNINPNPINSWVMSRNKFYLVFSTVEFCDGAKIFIRFFFSDESFFYLVYALFWLSIEMNGHEQQQFTH